MLARSIPARVEDDIKQRLIDQAYSAWLIGWRVHEQALTLAAMQGVTLSEQKTEDYLSTYPHWQDYLRSLGLIDEDNDGRKPPAQN